jgi:UDP-N-acetylglucosamine 2-epimerase
LTIHRAANTDDDQRLKTILEAIKQTQLIIVFPIHPRTQKMLQEYDISLPPNIIPTEPLSYFDMLTLESKADCILTDSGGVQKEAYWLGVRCITLREETEWIETVECGWNKIVGVEKV